MKIILIFCILSLPIFANSQTFKKDTVTSKVMIGLYPGFYFAEYLIDKSTNENARVFAFDLHPYVSYNLFQNIYLGTYFNITYLYSNFYKRENFKEVGVFIKYLAPYTIDKKFLKKFHFYTEFAYSKTNYRMVSDIMKTINYHDLILKEDFIISNRLNQSKISIPIGFTFQASQKLYIDLNWQYNYFFNGTYVTGFMGGIGYNFGIKK